jgi:hypothetical protein
VLYSRSDSLPKLERISTEFRRSHSSASWLEYWSDFLRVGEPKVNIGIGVFRNVAVQREINKTGEKMDEPENGSLHVYIY